MAYQGKEFRIHRDVNVEVMGVTRFVQLAFPFRRLPIWVGNRTEREVLNKDDVGMHGQRWIDERAVRMRWSSCWNWVEGYALEGVRRSRYFNPGKRGW